MTDKTIHVIHRIGMPLLQTLVWTIGLLSCFQLAFNHWGFLDMVTHGQAFLGIITIYLVYLAEMFLNILDTALINKEEKFNAGLLCLIAWFILDISVTFWLSLSFINDNIKPHSNTSMLYAIAAMAIMLKLSELLFSQNQEQFMHRTCDCTVKSRHL